MVLTNPPFGKKSSVTIVNEAGDEEKKSLIVHRDDFWASTSNKQLNFLQHVFPILKQHGRAAIVVPDNDSHLPSCSPFGLPVHVGRSRDLHCPFEGGAEVRDAIEFEQVLAQGGVKLRSTSASNQSEFSLFKSLASKFWRGCRTPFGPPKIFTEVAGMIPEYE